MENFEELLKNVVSEFARTLSALYPCDFDSDATLPEANLTSRFSFSLRENELYKDAVTWNEFSVPNSFREEPERNNGKKGNIDLVVYSKNTQEIVTVEAKLLHFKPKRKVIDCSNLPSDFCRAINVARSRDVFPKRLWDGLDENGRPKPILGAYNNFKTIGIALCGLWAKKKWNLNKEEIGRMFTEGLKAGIGDIDSKKAILVDQGKVYSEKVEVVLPKLQKTDWDYWLVAFVLDIEKDRFTFQIQEETEPMKTHKGFRSSNPGQLPIAPEWSQNFLSEKVIENIRRELQHNGFVLGQRKKGIVYFCLEKFKDYFNSSSYSQGKLIFFIEAFKDGQEIGFAFGRMKDSGLPDFKINSDWIQYRGGNNMFEQIVFAKRLPIGFSNEELKDWIALIAKTLEAVSF